MLNDGLYEQVINKELEAELSSTDKVSKTEPIDSAEASKVLAKYVAEVVERGLENLKENGGDLEDQVKLANQIITFGLSTRDLRLSVRRLLLPGPACLPALFMSRKCTRS